MPLCVASVGVVNRPGLPRTFPGLALKAHVLGHLSVSCKPRRVAFVDGALTVACGAPAPPNPGDEQPGGRVYVGMGSNVPLCLSSWGGTQRLSTHHRGHLGL